MKRAGIYNRCSTEEEAQINALESQAAESREITSFNRKSYGFPCRQPAREIGWAAGFASVKNRF